MESLLNQVFHDGGALAWERHLADTLGDLGIDLHGVCGLEGWVASHKLKD